MAIDGLVAIVLANIVVVDNIGMELPKNAMVDHHLTVVDNMGTVVVPIGPDIVVSGGMPRFFGSLPGILGALTFSLLDRDRDFLRGLPSESGLDESSISSGSVPDICSLSFDEARRERDLDCASGADDSSSSVFCFDFDVSIRLPGLGFGDIGLFFLMNLPLLSGLMESSVLVLHQEAPLASLVFSDLPWGLPFDSPLGLSQIPFLIGRFPG